jgi:DNA repair exonuclease SbcCD ATPase subunit
VGQQFEASSSLTENNALAHSQSPLNSDELCETCTTIFIKREDALKLTLFQMLERVLEEEKESNAKRSKEEKETNERKLQEQKEANERKLQELKQANDQRLQKETEANERKLQEEKEANERRLQELKQANDQRLQKETEANENRLKILLEEKKADKEMLQNLLSENDTNKSDIKKVKENLKIFAADKAFLFSSDLILFRIGKRHQPKTLATHCKDALANKNPEYLDILKQLQISDDQFSDDQFSVATDGFDAMIHSRNSLAHPTPTVHQLRDRFQAVRNILEILGAKEAYTCINPGLFYACWVLENYKDLLVLTDLPQAFGH